MSSSIQVGVWLGRQRNGHVIEHDSTQVTPLPMKLTLRLPMPVQTDLGLSWQFDYRGYSCRLVASEARVRLWMDEKEIDPSRVLKEDEQKEWRFMCLPHCLEYGVLARREAALGCLVIISEAILHRYADVLEGIVPAGYSNQ